MDATDRIVAIQGYMSLHAGDFAGLSDSQAADRYNAVAGTLPQTCFVNERTIYAELGLAAGVALMERLRILASGTDADAKQTAAIVSMLEKIEAGGIDVSLDETVDRVWKMVQGGLLTDRQADKLLALGQRDATLGESLGVGHVDHSDIAKSRGTWGVVVQPAE